MKKIYIIISKDIITEKYRIKSLAFKTREDAENTLNNEIEDYVTFSMYETKGGNIEEGRKWHKENFKIVEIDITGLWEI